MVGQDLSQVGGPLQARRARKADPGGREVQKVRQRRQTWFRVLRFGFQLYTYIYMIYLSIYIFSQIYLSISIYLSIYLSVCLSIYLSIYLYICVCSGAELEKLTPEGAR